MTAVLIVWLVLGVALLAVELHHLAFFAMFAALGAFAAAAADAVGVDSLGAQVGIAVGTGALGIVLVRPYVSRAVLHRRGERVAHGVHGGLVGSDALALDRIGGTTEPGHVRLAGERWLAVSGDGRPIDAGTPVTVTAVRGTTLTVWPADLLDLPAAPLDGK